MERNLQVFVSEYVCGGAWPEETLPGSLAREGKAMLLAVLSDFSRLPNYRVVTTWDRRLGDFPSGEFVDPNAISVFSPIDANDEQQLFYQLAAESDAAFVVAPEFDGILGKRRQTVETVAGRFLGCSASAIDLCSDKLLLSQHLLEHQISTINTKPFSSVAEWGEYDFPIVVKPRFGAGCQQTYLFRNATELRESSEEFRGEVERGDFVVQPFVAGTTCSVAAIISADATRVDVLPAGEQQIQQGPIFEYLGGRIPTGCVTSTSISRFIQRAIKCVPGLAGYIGFDFIVPDRDADDVLIVEINPRLTTSYLGYRELTNENLVERLLLLDQQLPPIVPPIEWKHGCVHFEASGSVQLDQMRSVTATVRTGNR